MEINENNLNLLNEENKFKFGYLCVKHIFHRVNSVVFQTFKDSEERRPIQAVEIVEKWLNDPKSVSEEELENAANAANAAWAARAAWAAASAAAWAAASAASAASAARAAAWAAAWAAASAARAASAASAAEEKWQEKLLDYIFNQQELSKSLKVENIDDYLNFVRDLMSKINYEGLKKCLGLRSLVYKHLKNEEEFQLCMDYLRSHNFFT